jgi:filamentous hemagglutinin family protein
MNKIYRSIWNEALNTWVAVSEIAKVSGKCCANHRELKRNSSTKNKHSTNNQIQFTKLQSLNYKLIAIALLLSTSSAFALPTGNQLVAGQATVSTPNANTMQIQQGSQNAVINWQGFSVGQNQAVNIQQPNTQAALLNRVVGQDASQIQGQINANGQVYLVNPNGVLFSKTAQVDVAGLVATTHDITNANFMAGTNHFTQNSATGTVQNDGTLNTKSGGVVALIGTSVTNNGTINTPNGTAALAAGKTVDLDFQGNGLVEVKVSEAALNAQITNNGAVIAEGGRVMMTAQAAGQLISTVINQNGIVKAQGMSARNGEIILDGGSNGTVNVSSTIDASSHNTANNVTGGNVTVKGQAVNVQNSAIINASGDAGGGTVAIGDKQTSSHTGIQDGAKITAQATDHGNAGTINVYANISNGTVNVAGNLDASAPTSGNGGKVETSAAQVKVADSARVSTKANNGNTGTWLIDPTDFTIATSGGDITGAVLSTNLASTGVTIASTSGANGVNGDVNVNDVVSWAANTLTLNAQRNININANLNGSGTAKLALQYGQASVNGGVNDNYFVNAAINLPAGLNFSTQKGSTAGNKINYTVIVDAATLQGMTASLAGNFALGANIDASTIANFTPIGNPTTSYSGNFAGLGHTISNLTINKTDHAGLFGKTSATTTIRDVGLVGGSVTGSGDYIASLVGQTSGSTINNTYATTKVIATGGGSYVGGLVGSNDYSSNISNSYATGQISAPTDSYVGGLVGGNYMSNISNSYATGQVSGQSYVGGLAGHNNWGSISNSFWNTQTTGQSIGVGSGSSTGTTGETSAQMMQASTFSNTGWSISNTGGSQAIWRIYEGNTAPLLRSFLTPYILIGTTDATVVYNGQVQTAGSASNVDSKVLGSAATGINVGVYNNGYYSNQQGYDLIGGGNLTITPAPLAAAIIGNPSKIYNGTINAVLTAANYNLTGFITGQGVSIAQTAGSYNTADVATANTVTSILASNNFIANLGTSLSNYILPTSASGIGQIIPAVLTYTANIATRVYGEANPGFSGTVTGFVNNENLANATTGILSFMSSANNTNNVGNYAIEGSGLTANYGNYKFVQAASNATALSITPALSSPVVTPVSPVISYSTTPVTPDNQVISYSTVSNNTTPVLFTTPHDEYPDLLEQLVPLQVSTTFAGSYTSENDRNQWKKYQSLTWVDIQNGGMRLPRMISANEIQLDTSSHRKFK